MSWSPSSAATTAFLPAASPQWSLAPALHGAGRLLLGRRAGGGFVAYAPPGVQLYLGEARTDLREWRVAAWVDPDGRQGPLDRRGPTCLESLSLPEVAARVPARFRGFVADHTRARITQLRALAPPNERRPSEDRSRYVALRLPQLLADARIAFPYEEWPGSAPRTAAHHRFSDDPRPRALS